MAPAIGHSESWPLIRCAARVARLWNTKIFSLFTLCGVADFVINSDQTFTLSLDLRALTAQSNMALSSEYKTAGLEVLEKGSSSREKRQALPEGLQTVGHNDPNGLEVHIVLRVATLITRLTNN
jgi:hypothetical protein